MPKHKLQWHMVPSSYFIPCTLKGPRYDLESGAWGQWYKVLVPGIRQADSGGCCSFGNQDFSGIPPAWPRWICNSLSFEP